MSQSEKIVNDESVLEITDFTALYLPELTEGYEDPSRSGFQSREKAWEYIFQAMCNICKEERERSLRGEESNEEEGIFVSAYPPCTCEWVIVETNKLVECDDLEEVFIASGFERIWSKESI